MIYLYALCPSSAESPDLSECLEGIGGAQVEVLTVEPLEAVIERDVDIAQIQADDTQLVAAILAHDRVLGHLFTQTPLLPLRFGTQFRDVDSVKTFLMTQGNTYRQKLDHLQDKAEYLIKLIPHPIVLPAIAHHPQDLNYVGKEQQLQIKVQTAALNQQAHELQHFLSALAAADIPLVRSAPQDTEERLHVLLSRDATTTQQLMQTWQQLLPTWQLVCSSPLPPYHFA